MYERAYLTVFNMLASAIHVEYNHVIHISEKGSSEKAYVKCRHMNNNKSRLSPNSRIKSLHSTSTCHPAILHDVRTEEEDVQNVMIVLIGYVNGTVTRERGGGPKIR